MSLGNSIYRFHVMVSGFCIDQYHCLYAHTLLFTFKIVSFTGQNLSHLERSTKLSDSQD